MFFNSKYWNKNRESIVDRRPEETKNTSRKPPKRTKGKLTRKKKAKKKYNLAKLKKELGNDMVIKLLLRLLDGRANPSRAGRPPKKEEKNPKSVRKMRLARGSGLPAKERTTKAQPKPVKRAGENQQDFLNRLEGWLLENNPTYLILRSLKDNKEESELRKFLQSAQGRTITETIPQTFQPPAQPAFPAQARQELIDLSKIRGEEAKKRAVEGFSAKYQITESDEEELGEIVKGTTKKREDIEKDLSSFLKSRVYSLTDSKLGRLPKPQVRFQQVERPFISPEVASGLEGAISSEEQRIRSSLEESGQTFQQGTQDFLNQPLPKPARPTDTSTGQMFNVIRTGSGSSSDSEYSLQSLRPPTALPRDIGVEQQTSDSEDSQFESTFDTPFSDSGFDTAESSGDESFGSTQAQELGIDLLRPDIVSGGGVRPATPRKKKKKQQLPPAIPQLVLEETTQTGERTAESLQQLELEREQQLSTLRPQQPPPPPPPSQDIQGFKQGFPQTNIGSGVLLTDLDKLKAEELDKIKVKITEIEEEIQDDIGADNNDKAEEFMIKFQKANDISGLLPLFKEIQKTLQGVSVSSYVSPKLKEATEQLEQAVAAKKSAIEEDNEEVFKALQKEIQLKKELVRERMGETEDYKNQLRGNLDEIQQKYSKLGGQGIIADFVKETGKDTQQIIEGDLPISKQISLLPNTTLEEYEAKAIAVFRDAYGEEEYLEKLKILREADWFRRNTNPTNLLKKQHTKKYEDFIEAVQQQEKKKAKGIRTGKTGTLTKLDTAAKKRARDENIDFNTAREQIIQEREQKKLVFRTSIFNTYLSKQENNPAIAGVKFKDSKDKEDFFNKLYSEGDTEESFLEKLQQSRLLNRPVEPEPKPKLPKRNKTDAQLSNLSNPAKTKKEKISITPAVRTLLSIPPSVSNDNLEIFKTDNPDSLLEKEGFRRKVYTQQNVVLGFDDSVPALSKGTYVYYFPTKDLLTQSLEVAQSVEVGGALPPEPEEEVPNFQGVPLEAIQKLNKLRGQGITTKEQAEDYARTFSVISVAIKKNQEGIEKHKMETGSLPTKEQVEIQKRLEKQFTKYKRELDKPEVKALLKEEPKVIQQVPAGVAGAEQIFVAPKPVKAGKKQITDQSLEATETPQGALESLPIDTSIEPTFKNPPPPQLKPKPQSVDWWKKQARKHLETAFEDNLKSREGLTLPQIIGRDYYRELKQDGRRKDIKKIREMKPPLLSSPELEQELKEKGLPYGVNDDFGITDADSEKQVVSKRHRGRLDSIKKTDWYRKNVLESKLPDFSDYAEPEIEEEEESTFEIPIDTGFTTDEELEIPNFQGDT